MKNSKGHIRKLMMIFCFALFGILFLNRLKIVDKSQATWPALLIRVDAPGADIYRLEELVTKPIESNVSSIGGIFEIKSTTEVGKVNIFITFNSNVDLNIKSIQIREKLDLLSAFFPREFHKPQLLKHDITLVPKIILTFSSEKHDLNELRQIVEKRIKPKIENLEGVSLIEIAGGSLTEIQILCDPLKLESYGISLLEIINKLQDSNQSYKFDFFGSNTLNGSVAINNKIKDIYDLSNLPISTKDPTNVIRIKDIARIEFKTRDEVISSRVNLKERISLFIYFTDEANLWSISNKISSLVLEGSIPHIRLEFEKNYAEKISKLITDFFLCVFVIYLIYFLYFNPFFVQLVLAFFCFLITLPIFVFIFVILNLSVTPFGMAGILIGLIFYLIYISKGQYYISIYSANSLFPVLCLGAIPCLMYFSENRFVFQWLEFYCSLIVSFLLFHLVFSTLNENFPLNSQLKSSMNLLPERYKDFFKNKINQIQKKSLDKYLSHKLLFPISILFLTSLGIFMFTRDSFLSETQLENLEINAILEFPPGTSYEYTNKVCLEMEKKLVELDSIDQVISKVEAAHAILILKFKNSVVNDQNFYEELRITAGDLGEGYLFFGGGTDSYFFNEFNYKIIGNDLNEIEKIANKMVGELQQDEATTEAFLRFKPSRSELELLYMGNQVLPSRMNVLDMGEQLRVAIQGGVATKLYLNGKETDVRVRFGEEFRSNLINLENYKVKDFAKNFLPVDRIISIRETKVPSKIYHSDKMRTLTFAVRTRDRYQKNLEKVRTIFSRVNVDPNVLLSPEKSQNSLSSLMIFQKLLFSLLVLVLTIIFSISLGRHKIRFFLMGSLFFVFYFLYTYLFQKLFDVPASVGYLGAFFVFISDKRILISRINLRYGLLVILVVNLVLSVESSELILILNAFFLHLILFKFTYFLSLRWVKQYRIQSTEFELPLEKAKKLLAQKYFGANNRRL